jgi:hypothetical protein
MKGDTEHIDTVIVGGGHAGLTMPGGPRVRDNRREVRFRRPDITLHRFSTFDYGDRRGAPNGEF